MDEKNYIQLKEDFNSLTNSWHTIMNNLLESQKRDLREILVDQYEFSLKTFGPGERTDGVIHHIDEELQEIKRDPTDLMEWIDVVILAFDGALRMGHTPDQIVEGYKAKLEINKKRKWPDWRTAELGKAINHIKE